MTKRNPTKTEQVATALATSDVGLFRATMARGGSFPDILSERHMAYLTRAMSRSVVEGLVPDATAVFARHVASTLQETTCHYLDLYRRASFMLAETHRVFAEVREHNQQPLDKTFYASVLVYENKNDDNEDLMSFIFAAYPSRRMSCYCEMMVRFSGSLRGEGEDDMRSRSVLSKLRGSLLVEFPSSWEIEAVDGDRFLHNYKMTQARLKELRST